MENRPQRSRTNHTTLDSVSVQDILYICLSKWYWFVVSLMICLGIAYFYLMCTIPMFTRTTSILIKSDRQGKSSTTEMEVFADFSNFIGSTNVEDEKWTLQSPDLMREVVQRLKLNVDYQEKGRFRNTILYGSSLPVVVEFLDLPENEYSKFKLTITEGESVSISDINERGDSAIFTGNLNDTIQCPIGRLVIMKSPHNTNLSHSPIYVTHIPLNQAITECSSRLSVTQNNDKTNIINLSYDDSSKQRADDILNTLIAVYNEQWVKDRNQIAVSTSLFINERLGVIESELGNVEEDISSYKSTHLMPDVQAAASAYISQSNDASTAIKALNERAYMVRHIRNYLTGEDKKQLLPANAEIQDLNISEQIAEYNSIILQRNNMVSLSSEKNPLVVKMDEQLSALRNAMIVSIDNYMTLLNAQIKSQQGYKTEVASKIASNPEQAKYLLSIERQQKVKESLYMYLLQKREATELSQAFSSYNTRIVSMPGGSSLPTFPDNKGILIKAFLIALFLPLTIIFLREYLYTKVRGKKDLENLTIPFIGEIPLWNEKKQNKLFNRKLKNLKAIVVKEGKRDVINEAFRVLRSNLEFVIGKSHNSNIIAITSFNPGSGKTFISMNLATGLAIKGKKVLVIDGDLRHASSSEFADSPENGISDYLSGRNDNIQELIIKYGDCESLYLLPVGIIPPNPTELLETERFKVLLDNLKKDYEYIIIDCPPVELVADTQAIAQHVDRTVFVVRAGVMERLMLSDLEHLYTEKKYTNMAMVLNGTKSVGGYRYSYRYGYHYGYGYGYHYGSDKKHKV